MQKSAVQHARAAVRSLAKAALDSNNARYGFERKHEETPPTPDAMIIYDSLSIVSSDAEQLKHQNGRSHQ